MSSITDLLSGSPDFGSIFTNLGVFALAVAAAIGGLWKGIRDIKLDGDNDTKSKENLSRIAQATLVETQTMVLWSESNRDVCEALKTLSNEVRELRLRMEIIDRVGIKIDGR